MLVSTWFFTSQVLCNRDSGKTTERSRFITLHRPWLHPLLWHQQIQWFHQSEVSLWFEVSLQTRSSRFKIKDTLASSTPLTSANLVLPSIWGLMSGCCMRPLPRPFSSKKAPRPLITTNMMANVRTVLQSWALRVGSACMVKRGFLADPISAVLPDAPPVDKIWIWFKKKK